MSYILDALRKADAQRERDPARGIHAQPLRAPVGRQRPDRGYPAWAWGAAAMGAVGLVAGGWYLYREAAAPKPMAPPRVAVAIPAAADAVTPAASPAASTVTAGPAAAAIEPPAAPMARPAPAPAPVRDTRTPPAPVRAGLQPVPAGYPTTPPMAAPSAAPVPSNGTQGNTAVPGTALPGAQVPGTMQVPGGAQVPGTVQGPGGAQVPGMPQAPGVAQVPGAGAPTRPGGPAPQGATQQTMPPAVNAPQPVQPPPPPPPPRAPLPVVPTPPVAGLPSDAPKLAISGGVYSTNPAQRMLIVNGLVFNEGSEVGPGVVLQEIKPKGAVLQFRGSRYTVSY